MGAEITVVLNISEGLAEISKKLMDLALAAQSAEPAAFLEDAESSYWHVASLRPRGRVFKRHGWVSIGDASCLRHSRMRSPAHRPGSSAMAFCNHAGVGVTHGEALTLPRAAAQVPRVAGGRATSASPLGLAMVPSLLAPSTESEKTTSSGVCLELLKKRGVMSWALGRES
uniref:Uncharacterized protein n=1 Tax=Oryza glumipatula TaxID=40148 RepID=A0A0D9YSM7_9ORYZ